MAKIIIHLKSREASVLNLPAVWLCRDASKPSLRCCRLDRALLRKWCRHACPRTACLGSGASGHVFTGGAKPSTPSLLRCSIQPPRKATSLRPGACCRYGLVGASRSRPMLINIECMHASLVALATSIEHQPGEACPAPSSWAFSKGGGIVPRATRAILLLVHAEAAISPDTQHHVCEPITR